MSLMASTAHMNVTLSVQSLGHGALLEFKERIPFTLKPSAAKLGTQQVTQEKTLEYKEPTNPINYSALILLILLFKN